MTDERLSPSPRALHTPLADGSGVLLHLDTKFYYTLNVTGAFVWTLLESREALTEAALVDRLTARFAVDADTARDDVRSLIADLRADGLLMVDTAG